MSAQLASELEGAGCCYILCIATLNLKPYESGFHFSDSNSGSNSVPRNFANYADFSWRRAKSLHDVKFVLINGRPNQSHLQLIKSRLSYSIIDIMQCDEFDL